MSPEVLIKSNNKDSKLKVKKTKKTICTQKVIRLEVSIKSNDKYSKHMVKKTKKTSDTKFKKAKMKSTCLKMLRRIHLYDMKKDLFQDCNRCLLFDW